jgi:hypothetical protein
MNLTKNTRKKIYAILGPYLRDVMFGDGQEQEYVMYGFNFTGLHNMNDKRLILEFELYLGLDDGEEDVDKNTNEYNLYQKAIKRLEK